MPYLLVRHKVADFNKWKAVYDARADLAERADLKEIYLLRNIQDPNEVFLLFEIGDLDKAREITTSSDLREAMQKAGVIDKPENIFLK